MFIDLMMHAGACQENRQLPKVSINIRNSFVCVCVRRVRTHRCCTSEDHFTLAGLRRHSPTPLCHLCVSVDVVDFTPRVCLQPLFHCRSGRYLSKIWNLPPKLGGKKAFRFPGMPEGQGRVLRTMIGWTHLQPLFSFYQLFLILWSFWNGTKEGRVQARRGWEETGSWGLLESVPAEV